MNFRTLAALGWIVVSSPFCTDSSSAAAPDPLNLLANLRVEPSGFAWMAPSASAPTVTFGGNDTLSGSFLLVTDSTFTASQPASVWNFIAPSWAPLPPQVQGAVPMSADDSPSLTLEFNFSGSAFAAYGQRSPYKLWIDGVPATLVSQQYNHDATFPNFYANVAFVTPGTHRIRWDILGNNRLVGFEDAPGSTISPITTAAPVRAVYMGDSIGEGTGSIDGYSLAICQYLAAKFGWHMTNMSAGGTGLVNGGVLPGRFPYIDRVQSDIVALAPDVVIIQGSINDGSGVTTTIAGQLLDAIQTGLPAARIYVVGPLGRYGVLTSQDLPSVAGLSDACASRGIPFFDTTANGFWFNPANDHTYFSGVTATATATIAGGAVTSVTVGNPGDGYDLYAGLEGNPAVSFSGGGGSGAAATANLNCAVTDLQLLSVGSGYTTTPSVTISCGALAGATFSGGAVTGFTVTNPGGNYLVPPSVTISGGGGTGAVATALIDAGRVVGLNLVSGGSGYAAAPSVSLSECIAPATAAASIDGAGHLTGLTITSGGSFYTSTPRVTIAGVGTGAVAVAHVSGTVDSITVTNGGSGYTSPPTVTIANDAVDVTHPKQGAHELIAERLAAGIIAAETANAAYLEVTNGQTLDLAGNTVLTNVQVDAGGTLTGTGVVTGSVANAGLVATTQGTVTLAGNVTNTGTMRAAGGAGLSIGGTLINSGLLDLMTASSSQHLGLVNNGTVLTASSAVVQRISAAQGNVLVSIQSYAGHNYQLQFSPTVGTGAVWSNVGPPQAGSGNVLDFTDPAGLASTQGFYRVVLSP